MIAASDPFVVTKWWAAGIALAALLVPAVVLHIVAARPVQKDDPSVDIVTYRRRGLGGLIIGADGRASTSKVQVVLWTFAVFFGIAFLLVWGRSSGSCPNSTTSALCKAAAEGRAAFQSFKTRDLQPSYVALLGIPVTAAVGARIIKTTKLSDGTVAENPVDPGTHGVVQSIREIVSDDSGQTDLLDFQYFAFNLLLLSSFFIQFLTDPASGLPELPATLLVLSGISAGGYVTKKALDG